MSNVSVNFSLKLRKKREWGKKTKQMPSIGHVYMIGDSYGAERKLHYHKGADLVELNQA